MKSFFIDTCEKTMFPTEYQHSLFIHWPQCFILNITKQIQVKYLCDEKGFSLRFVFSICRYYNQVKGSESLTAKYFLTYDIFKQLIQFFLFEYYADTNQSVWLPRELASYWGIHFIANYQIRNQNNFFIYHWTIVKSVCILPFLISLALTLFLSHILDP